MSFALVQAGTSIQKLSNDGTLTTLTLPAGLTLNAAKRLRVAVLSGEVFLVNAVSGNAILDGSTMQIRIHAVTKPATAAVAADGVPGNVRGPVRYRYSFIRMVAGRVLLESPWSDYCLSNASEKQVDLTGILASGDTRINRRRIYRTTRNGAEYYFLADISNNTTTTYTDNALDADLALTPAYEIPAAPPGSDATDSFRLVVEHKSRLFAAANLVKDYLYYTEISDFGKWPLTPMTVQPLGGDEWGINAFLKRRDELGIARRHALWKLVGTAPDDWELIRVDDRVGCVSQESVVVIEDIAYFLAENGVYRWGPSGVECISRDLVHPWFNTDEYFARSQFPNSFALWNPKLNTYELHLAGTGSTNIDRWVTFDIDKGQWLGPHQTAKFTPTCGGLLQDASGVLWPVIGGADWYLYAGNQIAFTDVDTAIDFDVLTNFHNQGTPDRHKYWGQLSLITRIEEVAGTLTITPRVGGLDAPAGAAISHNLLTGRQRLRRLGVGRMCQLRLRHATDNQGVAVYGYEIDPVHEVGRR